MKFADVFIGIIVIGIVLLIIFPLGQVVMDILLTLNLSLSLIILLVSLYTKNALEFSIFPSLLLVTTLFRLALNISSTRLILTHASAGKLIETFGNFVVGGNVAVGFIIFLIIIVVQFVVITKGAERVSEVAARFTLDAMPGKQMAIDADLNSGLIGEREAKTRRNEIQREADFYGAMDGASKFVKGDAIVGIIIVIINIVGGIIIGMTMMDMEISQVLSTYTLLTVGDGLVTQIPALLISTATGIIVTKAASESSLGQDLFKQITGQPTVLIISGILLCLMSILPGFPVWVLLPLGGLLTYLGFALLRSQQREPMIEEEDISQQELEDIRRPENVVSLLSVDPIELEFGYGIIPLADVNQGGDLLDRVVMIRRQMALELGLIVPVVRLRDNIQLNPNEYVIKIKGTVVASGEVLADRFMAMDSGLAEEEIQGIDTVEPAFGLPAKWIDEDQRENAELMGYTVVDPPSVIATHLTEVIKQHGHELLGRQEVQMLLDNLKERNSVLVEEVVPKLLSLGELQKILGNLIREGISIRDMVTILETLADYAGIVRDPDLLTEYVRQALSRAITQKFIPDNKGKVLTLDNQLEKEIMDNVQQTEHGSYLSMAPEKTQRIFNNLMQEVSRISSLGMTPIVLTSPVVRIYFKRLTEQVMPDLVVLSYNELDSRVEVQSLGVVSG
ncbi:MAG: flagellar biosynthesis protein FlhA [Clostridiales bacterium]|nr:flagellar biosynthesis protein FlhA [Clostridiales bacterium]